MDSEGTGRKREGRASAQGTVESRGKTLERLLAARATGGAFGATSRGAATLPVVMLRVLVELGSG